MIIISLFVLFALVIFLFFEVQKEKRRNRILQSFTAGIIRSISDYVSRTDEIKADDISKIYVRKFPIPYNEILAKINHEFSKDFWMNPFGKWLKKDRNIFYDDKYSNDGFNMIYWDFYDQVVAEIKKEREEGKNSQHQINPADAAKPRG